MGDVVGGPGEGTTLGVFDRMISDRHMLESLAPAIQFPMHWPSVKQFPSGVS